MSLRLNLAARRAYDLLKTRPGAPERRSDARDSEALEAVTVRLRQLISEYRVNGHHVPNGGTFVFWTEVESEVRTGSFDDLLPLL